MPSPPPRAAARVPLVLASASPARLETLRRAGIDPVVVVSAVDEALVLAEAIERDGPLAPAEVALLLARAKAEDVAARGEPGVENGVEHAVEHSVENAVEHSVENAVEHGLVLGCDSVLELDGEAHGKPVDADDAIRRWRRMRGRSGVLHTGHWLIDRVGGVGAACGSTASTTVHFAWLSDDEIAAYVATGEPLLVAGAFAIDGLGGPFVTAIEGDHHNVVGLSLPLLRELLAQVGTGWFSMTSGS